MARPRKREQPSTPRSQSGAQPPAGIERVDFSEVRAAMRADAQPRCPRHLIDLHQLRQAAAPAHIRLQHLPIDAARSYAARADELGYGALWVPETVGRELLNEIPGVDLPNQWKDVVAFTLLVLVLIFRPTGIFKQRAAKRA